MEPFPDPLWLPEQDPAVVPRQSQRHSQVPLAVDQLHPLDLRQTDLEDEAAHLSNARRPFLEALEIVAGEDEEPLLPPGEQLVSLLPQQALLDGGTGGGGWGVAAKAGGRVGGGGGGGEAVHGRVGVVHAAGEAVFTAVVARRLE